ncbi:MAG: flagellin [Verrucomicrobium sp.]|nr:flagellin [Verrucomicrobium sp.]
MTVIGTNYAASMSGYYLNRNTTALNQSLEQLSSGSRLTSNPNDAAGLAVAGQLTAQNSRLGSAINSANDVISFAQTADGFLSTIQSMLTRMSELAQEATNGAFGSSDLANYQTEYSNLLSTLDLIASNASFNNSSIFSNTTLTVCINGFGAVDSLVLNTIGYSTSLGINLTSLTTTASALTSLSALNSAISCITNRRAMVNADISKFNFHISNMQTEQVNIEAATSAIADLDMAAGSTALSKNQILVQAATSMLAQANASQQTVLTLLRSQ